MEENKDVFIITDDNNVEEQITKPTEVVIESEVLDEPLSSYDLDSSKEEERNSVDEPPMEPMPEIEDETLSDDQEVQPKESPNTVDVQYIAALLEQMAQKYDCKIAVDEHKNQLFDKMYGELKSLRDDQFSKAIKPIFMDLIVMIDNINKMASKYNDDLQGEELQITYKKLKTNYQRVGEHIQDLLYNYGIEPFESSKGVIFNSKQQQVKKSSDISDIEDKSIVESLYPGYYWGEIMLRKEGVHINMKKESDN